MTISTEELLRRALQRQAERAPDPDRVRMELPRRAVRRTRRRYGSIAGGLVAAAALTAFAVPVLALDDDPAPRGAGPAAPASSPSASALPSAAPTAPAAVALRYRPTWLPAGLTERSRTVPLATGYGYDGPVRVWKRANTDPGFDMGGARLEFAAVTTRNGADQFGDDGKEVDINGRPGRLSGGSAMGKSSLHWVIDPQTVIFIHNVESSVSEADLLRIARSVQPDPGQVPVPMRFGWLPAGMAPASAQLSGDSAARWQLEVAAIGKQDNTSAGPEKGESATSAERGVYARLGTTTDAPEGGESTVIGGRPARVVTRPIEGPKPTGMEHAYVVVELASGLKLTVFGVIPDVSREDLIATAAAVQVGTVPDLGWLGAAAR